jgi:carboxylesterase
MVQSGFIKNPQLEGDAFFWQAGPIGILLIHGFTATTAEVRPLAKKLFAKGYTISGPLLPGHGTYPRDLNRVTWKDWVAEVEKAYQELRIHCTQVVVAGESTGGLLALYLVSRHPESVAALVYAPALKIVISSWNKFLLHLLAPFVPYMPKKDDDDGLPWKGYTVNPLKGTIQLLRLQHQVKRLLPTIRRPVLIIQGRLDFTVDPEVPETISNNIRSVIKEIHWMENSSHCVILDHELDQVTDITLRFLAKVQA